jgi:hypothetical protein
MATGIKENFIGKDWNGGVRKVKNGEGEER